MVFRYLPASSVGTKIVWLVSLASTVAVVVACAVMLAQVVVQLRSLSHSFMVTDARLYAINLAAPLAFNDTQAARETLVSLKTVPNLAEARLFDHEGVEFSGFQAEEGLAPITQPPPPGSFVRDGYMIVTEPVRHDSRPLGTLVLAYNLRFLYGRLAISTLLAVMIAAGAISAAVILAFRLRYTVTEPVNELMTTAHDISDRGDYSVRARRISDDEFGELTDAFNAMLNRIGQQDQAIRVTNDELRTSNEEMEQFVYTVSHDLKSPLVTITGFVGLLRQDLETGHTEDITDSLQHIEGAAVKMGALIEDLLQLSRVGRMEYQFEQVEPAEVVQEVLDGLDQMIEQQRATVNVQPNLPDVWGDRRRLAQLMQNLIENALKYGCPKAGECVEVGGHREGNQVCLYVRDQGPGIDPQYHERIFGLFQRVGPTDVPGTGIGLAIAKRIAEAHDGQIRVESGPGQGATFWLTLPDQRDPALPELTA